MDESAIIAKLDTLAAANDQLRQLTTDLSLRKNSLITPEIREQMDTLDAEVGPLIEAAGKVAGALEAEIKAVVLDRQASVKGSFLHAVWSKGRVTWNSDSLEGYALAHPEILNFQKVGQPSVSIREAK